MKKVIVVIIISVSMILLSNCAGVNDTPPITKSEASITPFFFDSNLIQFNYKGTFLFDDINENEIIIHVNEVANLEHGKLYEVKLDSVDFIPNDRLMLGYFYVQEDIIYKIEPTEDNFKILRSGNKLPDDAKIVCQDKEVKDSLGENELGLHQYILVNGNKREYHSYNNLVESGYYESFTWELNKGLIYYKSGFGAERDSIELQIKD